MSARIETLRTHPRLGHRAWLAGLFAVLVALTVALVAISLGRDRSEEASRIAGTEETVTNTSADLPAGLSRGSVAAVSGATIDLPAGLSRGSVPASASDDPGDHTPFGRRQVTPRVGSDVPTPVIPAGVERGFGRHG